MRGVPPGSVCGSGWLVCEVLLPSRAGGLGGDRALWSPLQTASWARIPSGRVLLGHHGPASLTGCPLSEALCLSSLWSLVLTCPPHPSPSPSLSLSLFLYPLLSLLCLPNSLIPPSSSSSPPFLLHPLSYVDGQGHSHRNPSSSVPTGSWVLPWATVREISRI